MILSDSALAVIIFKGVASFCKVFSGFSSSRFLLLLLLFFLRFIYVFERESVCMRACVCTGGWRGREERERISSRLLAEHRT